MATTTLAFLLITGLGTNPIVMVEGKNFLNATSAFGQNRMSEEAVQTSLLAEVEGAFGENTAFTRVKPLEGVLGPMYAALPKNEKGYLGHSTVRYALHRLFVERHGWAIKGLDSEGGHRNCTSSAGLLKEQVPAYIQDLFEKRLGDRGFGLHELAVLAATIEHLIHVEATERVAAIFQVHDLLPTAPFNESVADELLDTYMIGYIVGEDLSTRTLEAVQQLKGLMPELHLQWNDTKEFVRGVRRDTAKSHGSAELRASGELDFALFIHTVERVSEQFGKFQHQKCEDMKASLVEIEEQGTGRVRLSDFYKPALNGQWQFHESVSALKNLGALDESDIDKPRVIIANYLSSLSNCITPSNFYSVCCIDACEGLLGHLEQEIAAPETTPEHIAAVVANLSSSSIVAPRQLSSALMGRLGEIAAEHGGTVPLHGRLFAQWMHHAFPRECPYPHISGTTNPQSVIDQLEVDGDISATDEEMLGHVGQAEANSKEDEIAELPWAPEEELLVVRHPQVKAMEENSLLRKARNGVLFAALVSIAYTLVRSFLPSQHAAGHVGTEKVMV